jgi:ribonuclease P protein component
MKTGRLSSGDLRVFRPRTRVQGRFFTLALGSPNHRVRFACIASKKVASKAVARNRIRRRCRAIVRGEATLPRATFVLIAKRGSADASFAELADDIHSLFARTGR